MLQSKTWKRPRSRMALLAIGVAAGAVIWHILACWEAPMSFSPSGDLAFTVMDPYDEGGACMVPGACTYRLLVLRKDRTLHEVERTTSHMLSGAGYDPGGERLAYLRVALPTKEGFERAEAFTKRLESGDPGVVAAAIKEGWFFAAPPGTADRPPKPFHEDADDALLLPSLQIVEKLPQAGALLPAELVVRSASGDAVLHTLPVDVPYEVSGKDVGLLYTYLFARPQWLANGTHIYFYVFPFSAIASVAGTKAQLLDVGAELPGPVSPDRRTVASVFSQLKLLHLTATDGSRSVYARLAGNVKPGGIAWVGQETLAALSARKASEYLVEFFDRDGRRLRSQTLTLAGETKDERPELAVAPDGKHMVVSLSTRIHFLAANGQSLGEWQSPTETQLLARPTFSVDSKQVAFRLLEEREDKKIRTAAIVFFTPQGKEVVRVAVPPVEPAAAAEGSAKQPKAPPAPGK